MSLARDQIRHRSKHLIETLEAQRRMKSITREVDGKTYSIALKIRHFVGLVQVLGDGRLAAPCWAGNDPDVLVL